MSSNERIERLRRLLESEPNDPFCLYGLAQEYEKSGEPDHALAHYERTIDADPDYFYAYFFKGRILAGRGKVHDARETIRRGLERARAAGDEKAEGELGELLQSID